MARINHNSSQFEIFSTVLIARFLCSISSFVASNEVPTLNTIDSYMTKLHQLILDSPQEHENLVSTVREIIGRVDLQG